MMLFVSIFFVICPLLNIVSSSPSPKAGGSFQFQIPFVASSINSGVGVRTGNKILSDHTKEYIDQFRERWGVRGISIGLVSLVNSTESTSEKGQGKSWLEETLSFGTADVQGNQVTPDSLFAIASNSKLFTSIAVGLLIDNHTLLPNGQNLDWSTKIKDILPDWQLMDGYASDHVDILDLLSMRSGMPRHDFSHGSSSPAEVVANLRNLRPSHEIRQVWQYNNAHYFILSHIIPTLTGISFIDYVQTNIFDPLGMGATYNSTLAKETGRRTHSFLRKDVNLTRCKETWSGVNEIDQSCLGQTESIDWWTEGDGIHEAGAGGVILSANDMVKWLKELLEPKTIPSYLINKAVSPLMVISPQPSLPEESIKAYGLAQWTYTYRGYPIEGHTGSLPGQRSIMFRVPSLGIGGMIANNDEFYGEIIGPVLVNVILDDLLDLDKIDWEERLFTDRIIGKGGEEKPDVPMNPRLPPSKKSLIGEYFDKGYGGFTLSSISLPKDMKGSLISFGNGDEVIEISKSQFGPKLNITGPMYLAQVDKTFNSHILFTHFDGPLFNWTTLGIHPIYSTKEWITDLQDSGTAVFVQSTSTGDDSIEVERGGIGMFGNYWGKSTSIDNGPPVVESGPRVKETAEVWYARV